MTSINHLEIVKAAAATCDGYAGLAKRLGVTRWAVNKWQRIPAERVVQVEAVTGLPREFLRPDLFCKTPHV